MSVHRRAFAPRLSAAGQDAARNSLRTGQYLQPPTRPADNGLVQSWTDDNALLDQIVNSVTQLANDDLRDRLLAVLATKKRTREYDDALYERAKVWSAAQPKSASFTLEQIIEAIGADTSKQVNQLFGINETEVGRCWKKTESRNYVKIKNTTDCPICYNPKGPHGGTLLMPCAHSLCNECADNPSATPGNKCPICRTKVQRRERMSRIDAMN